MTEEHYENLLEGADYTIMNESLSHLERQKNDIALNLAVDLLEHEDSYIWLNTAEYLASFGNEASVPYLIKGLRHTAWRGDEKRVQKLREMTGQNFGNDFTKWQKWWKSQNPEVVFDWKSKLGFRPRTS